MQRACAAALLKKGTTVLHNPGTSADDNAALGIIQQLGAIVKKENDTIIIESNGISPMDSEIDCGESGLSSRMFTSIAALSKTPMTIKGTGSLVKRPFSFFTEVLPQLSVECRSNGGRLPLQVSGPLQPRNIEIDGSQSSQFLTGLLFAFSAAGAENVTLTVKELNSKPYIDLTLDIMHKFGLPLPINNNYQSFYFTGRQNSQLHGQQLNYHIEGDWSGAAFLLVGGAIKGELIVTGLNLFSAQADKAILQPLIQSGANISIEEKQISVRQSRLKPFHFNAKDCPDLFPPLVALASYCDGISVIEGIHRLTHKESNRALTLQEEFRKMGVDITLQDDLMLIKGSEKITGANVHSRHDHRIAMACAVAALGADSEVMIDEAEAVNKSYPQFWEHLQRLTVKMSLRN
jgi:3-phosphoshikimate 1-carboxyvinyltransferase